MTILIAIAFLSSPVPLDYSYSAKKTLGPGAATTSWEALVVDVLCDSVVSQFGIDSEDCDIDVFDDYPLSIKWVSSAQLWKLSSTITFPMNWTAVGGSGSVPVSISKVIAGTFDSDTGSSLEQFVDNQLCPSAEEDLGIQTNLCTGENFKSNGIGVEWDTDAERWQITARLDYSGTAEVQ